MSVTAAAGKPKFAPVSGVEIFQAGTWRGKVYTEQDLDEMVANFAPLKENAGLDPTIAVGHEESQPLMQNSGYPKAGDVARIWREGQTLFADLVNVPPLIAYLLEGRCYEKVSAEVYDDFENEATGQHHGKALRRVSILGAELPQIKTLAEIPKVYFGDDGFDMPVPPAHRKAALKYQEIRPGKAGNTFHIFCEVNPMTVAAKPKRQKVAKFSDKAKATFAKFADEAMPDAAAPPPAGVTRDDLLAMLTEMGFDPAMLAGIADDAVLAEIVRVNKSGMSAMAEPKPAPQAGTQLAEPITPPIAPVVTPPVAPASGIPGVPNATPSQVTLRFGESDNVDITKIVNDAVAAALKPLQGTLETTKQDVDKFHETTKKAGIDAKLESLVKAGKVLPAEIDAGLRDQLYRANGIAKFADGKTELDKQLAILEARPQILKFSEQVKAGKPGSASAEEEVHKVERFAEQNAGALKAAGKTAVTFVNDFKKAREKRPDLTAKEYAGIAE